jgi:hypothetical protein
MNSTAIRRRQAITNTQKRALRQFYQVATLPKPKYEALQAWYQNEYGGSIRKSSISDILSSKYAYLDDDEFIKDQMRERPIKWGLLEECLFEWEQRYEACGGIISGDIL